MSSLDDLCYYMASAGYPPDIIAKAEQAVLHSVRVSGIHPDRIVSAMRAMLEFEASMTQLTTHAGTAMSDMQAIVDGIEAMADMPPSKLPYYQKNTQHWWK